MKKTAVMMDGGFVFPQLKKRLKRPPTAADLYEFGLKTLDQTEELFRLYFYDCPPFEGKVTNPISGQTTDYAQEPFARDRKRLLSELVIKDHVAFRRGVLSFDGWQVKPNTINNLITAATQTANATSSLTATDVYPKFSQKRVDMNIGLDVAWLSSKRIVERIVLVTADSDFIPAMKFARREGIQIVLVPLEGNPKFELKEHADITRSVTYP
jgi:uncharacterized LabA/DUF88 family protein